MKGLANVHSREGIVPRHTLVRRVQIDFGFGMAAKTAVAPADLDMTIHGMFRPVRSSAHQGAPADQWLTCSTITPYVERTEFVPLPPIPRRLNPQTKPLIPGCPKNEIRRTGKTKQSP